jgi:hypothetical protein
MQLHHYRYELLYHHSELLQVFPPTIYNATNMGVSKQKIFSQGLSCKNSFFSKGQIINTRAWRRSKLAQSRDRGLLAQAGRRSRDARRAAAAVRTYRRTTTRR